MGILTQDDGTPRRGASLALLLLAGVVAFCIYLPVRDGDYVFDDRKLIIGNEELLRPNEGLGDELGVVLRGLGGLFRAEEADASVRTAFRPVRFASLRLDVRITRALGIPDRADGIPSPLVFHLHNALLHALNTILLGLLVVQLRPRIPVWFPALFALAFALHPVQTESVAYMTGRRDVLFSAFFLLALLVYAGGRRDGGWGRGLVIALLTWLALGAKEMAVTLPVVLVLLEGFGESQPGDRPGFRRVIDRLPLWAPSLAAALVFAGFLLTGHNPGGGTGYWGGSPWTAFWSSARAGLEYLWLLVWPHPLTVDYSFDAFPASRGPFAPLTGALSLACIAGALAFAWFRRRRHPELATAIVLFPVLLAPVAQWIPHPERFAEHNLYLPSIAFLVTAAVLLRVAWRNARELTVGAIGLVLLVWGALAVDRLDAWAGPYPLWRSAAEAHPRCARAHVGWGNAAQQRGRSAEAVAALGTAVELLRPVEREPLQQGYYQQALRIRAGILAASPPEEDRAVARAHLETLLGEVDTDGTPLDRDPVIWMELLKVREALGDRGAALAAAERLRELDAAGELRRFDTQEEPGRIDATSAILLQADLFVAGARAEAGDPAAAEEVLIEAMRRASTARERALVWFQIGVHRQRQERWAEALDAFERAETEIGPEGRRSSALYEQAECLLNLSRIGAARAALEEILADDPGHLPAMLSLAEIQLGAGEHESARDLFAAVLGEVSDEPRAVQGLRQALARIAMEETPAAPSADPTRITALTMLADRMEAEEKWLEAYTALEKAESLAEGPTQRERRLALRLRLARLCVRRGYLASREGEEDFAIAQLEEGARWYGRVRELASPEERGEAALGAADLARILSGPAAARAILEAEYAAGVEEPRLLPTLGGLAEQDGDPEAAARWYRAARDDPSATEEVREAAREALRRLGVPE